jgi:hypothetical protein
MSASDSVARASFDEGATQALLERRRPLVDIRDRRMGSRPASMRSASSEPTPCVWATCCSTPERSITC